MDGSGTAAPAIILQMVAPVPIDGVHRRKLKSEDLVEADSRTYPGKVHRNRPDPDLIDRSTGRIPGIVCQGTAEGLDERRLKIEFEGSSCKIHRAARVAHHLDAPRFGDIIEEPAATRLHQHRLPFHIKERQGLPLFIGGEITERMPGEELLDGLIRPPVEDEIDSIVPCHQGVAKVGSESLHEPGGKGISDRVNRYPEWFTPGLRPFRMRPGLAPTISSPALDTVRAAPGRPLLNDNLVRGRVSGEILSVNRKAHVIPRLDGVEAIGERHLAELTMVAVGLPVGRDMHKLRALPIRGEGRKQPSCEPLPV